MAEPQTATPAADPWAQYAVKPGEDEWSQYAEKPAAPATASPPPTPGLLKRTDDAINSALAPNPENYRSFGRTQIEVPKTLGREIYSGVKTIAGMPGGIYHAFADEPTAEETAEAGGPDQVSGAKRVGLGIGRLTAAPFLHAIKDYSSGNVTLDNALEVAPEAIGAGAGNVVGGKLAAETGSRVANAVVPRAVRFAARTGEALANQKVAPIRPILSIDTPADEAGATHIKIPGRDFGLPKSAETPAPDIYRTGFRAPRAFYGGQPPEPIPSRPGLQLEGEVAQPIQGEYMPAEAPQPKSEAPFVSATPVRPRTPEPAPAPYRRAGDIEPEDVGAPDPNVLAHRGGVIVRRPVSRGLMLNAAPEAAEPAAAIAPGAEVEPAAPPVQNFTPGRITPTGERYLDQMREFVRNLPKEAAEAEAPAVNMKTGRPLFIRNVVADPEADLESVLEESKQFARRNGTRRRVQ